MSRDFILQEWEQEESHADGSDAEEEMYCELCKSKGRFRTAEGFCVDCVKYYCSNCLDCHSNFLPTHDLKDKHSMPQDVCVQPCLKHEDEIIKFYCCDKFFCSLCKQADHTECPTVYHLPALVQETDVARYLNELKEKIAKTLRNIKKRENGINLKTSVPRECAEKAKEALHSMKNEILEWLDQHVACIEKEIEEIQTLDEQALQSEGAAMSALNVVANTVTCGLDSKNPSSKRCELFMALKDYERQQKQIEERVKEERQHTVTRYKFKFKSSKNLRKLLEEKIFGELAKKATKKEEATFSFTVENVSKLKTQVSSERFKLQSLKWQIVVGRQKDTEVNKEYLSVFLKCDFDTFSCKFDSCNAGIELRIINQNDDDFFCRKSTQMYCSNSCSWGYRHYLLWDELLDPEKGYCMDDRIILQAHVIADPPQ